MFLIKMPRWGLLIAMLTSAISVPAYAEVIALSDESDAVVGKSYRIQTRYGETAPMLAQAHEVGFHELLWANPEANSWMPGEGTWVEIPRRYILPGRMREGIVLNIAELRLYVYERDRDDRLQVRTYPVSIGRLDWTTPLGKTEVVDRLENPSWYPPASVRLEHQGYGEELPRVVEAGPDNPLGEYALMLGTPGYFIHGTNRDEGIGLRVTHGCIRLRSSDIKELIYRVPVGTPVEILSMPIKVGLREGAVYVEIHERPLIEFPVNRETPVLSEVEIAAPFAAFQEQLPAGEYVIYWDQVMEAARQKLGVPIAVGWDRTVAPLPEGRPELLWRVEATEPVPDVEASET